MNMHTLAVKPIALAVAMLGITLSLPASAFKIEMENGLEATFDSTVSFGLQRRMQSPNRTIIGNDNGGNVATSSPLGAAVNGPGQEISAIPDFNYLQADDGNLNYNKGDIVSAVLKGTHEFFIKDPGNWAALARGTWSTDLRADHTRRVSLDPEAQRAVNSSLTLLDLWVSKDFRLGDNAAKVKLGNQVVSWGEDIFIIGGVNSINALDLRKIHIPGVQLKEVFVPAPMLSFSSALGDGFSTEAYYQFRWNKFVFDPAGTYWSSADFLGKGGKRGAYIPTSVYNNFGIPVAPGGTPGDFSPSQGRTLPTIDLAGAYVVVEQTSPKNTGQYGVNFRFKPQESDTEYAFYYIHYHDKLPFVGWRNGGNGSNVFGNVSAVEQYGEDRSLYGISMNTKLGDWAVGAELSYRPKDSVAIDPTVPYAGVPYSVFNVAPGAIANGYKDEDKWQAHVTGFKLLSQELTRPLGAAEGYVMGEVAVTRYPGLDLSGAVPYLLNNYTFPDKTSWGYVAEFGLTYANIFNSGWTFTPIVDFYHDVHGTSPNTLPFVEGRKALAIGLNFDYHNKVKATLGYTTFWGGGDLNMLRDRDVLTASVSYAF